MREKTVMQARNSSVVGFLQSLGINGQHKNGRFLCRSPLREEKTPSFTVTIDKNVWYDFGLGLGGDVISLVMKVKNCDFIKAVEYLAGADLKDDKSKSEPSTSSRKETTPTEVPPDTGQSKSGKRIVEKFLSAAGLPFYPEIEAFPLTFKGSNYIGFPVPNPAERLGIECRGFRLDQGFQSSHLRMTLGRKLPWVFIRNPKRILVTESIFDSLAGEVILGDTDISLVALNGVGNVKLLPNYIKNAHVQLAMDNDGPENGKIGQKMSIEAELLLLQNGCTVSHLGHHTIAGAKDFYRLLKMDNKK